MYILDIIPNLDTLLTGIRLFRYVKLKDSILQGSGNLVLGYVLHVKSAHILAITAFLPDDLLLRILYAVIFLANGFDR